MSAFRNDYAAAVDRAEHLAEENEELRAEVARLRGASPEVEPVPALEAEPIEPADQLARQTLDRLEQFSAQLEKRLSDAPPSASEGMPRRSVKRVEELPVERTDAPRPLDVPAALHVPDVTSELARLRDENIRLAAALSRAQHMATGKSAVVALCLAVLVFLLGYDLRGR